MSAGQHVRRLSGGSWVRDEPGEYLSGGSGSYLHLSGPGDESAGHVTYPTGYDSRCGWCYLGAPHTVAAHAVSVATAVAEHEGRAAAATSAAATG